MLSHQLKVFRKNSFFLFIIFNFFLIHAVDTSNIQVIAPVSEQPVAPPPPPPAEKKVEKKKGKKEATPEPPPVVRKLFTYFYCMLHLTCYT